MTTAIKGSSVEPEFNVKEDLDWRDVEEEDIPDDDEPLTQTPQELIDILGFDPLKEMDDAIVVNRQVFRTV